MEKKSYTFDEIKLKMANYCVYQDRCHYEVISYQRWVPQRRAIHKELYSRKILHQEMGTKKNKTAPHAKENP